MPKIYISVQQVEVSWCHMLGRHPLKGTISSNCKKLYDKMIWYEVILWRYNDIGRNLNSVFTHSVSN